VYAQPLAFSISTITYKVVVYAPAERAAIPIPTLPLYVLCGTCKNNHVVRTCLSAKVFAFVREDTCIREVCACAKLLIYRCMREDRYEKNRGMTVSDQLICQYFILRHHVVEVANDLDFSIDVKWQYSK
jgi:hypothetical protein